MSHPDQASVYLTARSYLRRAEESLQSRVDYATHRGLLCRKALLLFALHLLREDVRRGEGTARRFFTPLCQKIKEIAR
jgi:hypothetical protein